MECHQLQGMVELMSHTLSAIAQIVKHHLNNVTWKY
jgi:hypothetical protein